MTNSLRSQKPDDDWSFLCFVFCLLLIHTKVWIVLLVFFHSQQLKIIREVQDEWRPWHRITHFFMLVESLRLIFHLSQHHVDHSDGWTLIFCFAWLCISFGPAGKSPGPPLIHSPLCLILGLLVLLSIQLCPDTWTRPPAWLRGSPHAHYNKYK